MKNKISCSLLATLFFINLTSWAQENQTPKTLNIQPITEYLLYLPKDYSTADQKTWPLILFLHGAGERGDSLNLVKEHGPPKLIEEGQDFPFIIASPQCPTGQRWSSDELNILLNDLIRQYKVDKDRIYLTGLSMGGYGTWDLATRYPERFAAIAPICGGGEPKNACQLKDIPTWVFHGAKDEVVFPYQSEKMVEALKACGGDVHYTRYPEAHHDSWTATYANPALYEWFLKHKKQNKWADEFTAFDTEDSLIDERKEVMLFTGSSSIRMWKSLHKDLGNNALNRGFGGSTYTDLLKDIERVILRYNPKKVFIYSGDNDIASGKSAEEVFTDFRTVFYTIRGRLPNTAIYIISSKPSPSRKQLLPEIIKFNQYAKDFLAYQKNAAYIDIFTPMLDKNGQPRQELFLEDDLHMNKKGYALWTKAIKPHLAKP